MRRFTSRSTLFGSRESEPARCSILWRRKRTEKMKKLRIAALTIRAVLALFATPGFAQQYKFIPIDAPCDSCPNKIVPLTIASGINEEGDVVGSFKDSLGGQHGFLLHHGSYTKIDVPGKFAGVAGTLPTSANGINAEGAIVGYYVVPFIFHVSDSVPQDSPTYCPAPNAPACTKGFLLRHGSFSTVLFRGHSGTVPQHITEEGDIYGCLHDANFGRSMFGAVWSRRGDMSLTVNGGELSDPRDSKPLSMNNGAAHDGRTIVGLWADAAFQRHGFLVQDGVFTSYDVPGNPRLTAIWDINSRGEFVGVYVDSTGVPHGFLQPPGDSAPIVLDFTLQGVNANSTIALGINAEGIIVGQYFDVTNNQTRGFLAVPPRREEGEEEDREQ